MMNDETLARVLRNVERGTCPSRDVIRALIERDEEEQTEFN